MADRLLRFPTAEYTNADFVESIRSDEVTQRTGDAIALLANRRPFGLNFPSIEQRLGFNPGDRTLAFGTVFELLPTGSDEKLLAVDVGFPNLPSRK